VDLRHEEGGQVKTLRSRGAGGTRACTVFLLFALMSGLVVRTGPDIGMAVSRPKQTASVGTPVSSPAVVHDLLDGRLPQQDQHSADPLDGDPLDGAPSTDDAGLSRFGIVRSGRPDSAPRSLAAYDDDPDTIWSPDAASGDQWLWLDLGENRRLRRVRWLAAGSGAVAFSVSNDRQRWVPVDTVEVRRGWQAIDVREDAQYVSLELSPSEDGTLPGIAEVEIYGRDANHDTVFAQKAGKNKGGKHDHKRKSDRNSNSGSNAKNKNKGENKSNKSNGGTKPAGNQNGITAEPGETDCTGDHERCRTREGTVDVNDDCHTAGTCTIDVQADGGSATCDAVGGNESKAGKGKGKRGGEGGRCGAVADGGAVTIGDINP
jgi:hypothetical protein